MAPRGKRAPRNTVSGLKLHPKTIMTTHSTKQKSKMSIRPKNPRLAALLGSGNHKSSSSITDSQSEEETVAKIAVAEPFFGKSAIEAHQLPTRVDMYTIQFFDWHVSEFLKVIDPLKYEGNNPSPEELRVVDRGESCDSISYIHAPQFWEHESNHEAVQIATVVGYALYARARDQRTPPIVVKNYLEKHLAEGHWGPKQIGAATYGAVEEDEYIDGFGDWKFNFELNGVFKRPVDLTKKVEPWGEYETTFLQKLIDVLDAKIQLGGR